MQNNTEKLVREAEGAPNLYAAKVMRVTIIIVLFVLVINELDLYHVPLIPMRIGIFSSLVVMLIPQIIVLREDLLYAQSSKYVIMSCALFITLILSLTLSFHSTMILVLPMLLATQYHSRQVCWVAAIGSCCIAVIAPLLGFLLGFWDTYFLSTFVEIGEKVSLLKQPLEDLSLASRLGQTFLYISLPHVLILIALGIIMFNTAQISIDNLNHRLEIVRFRERDILTGLLNRNSFETKLSDYCGECQRCIICVYADANGLHELNNTQGHAAGDQMLRCIATAMQQQFGADDTYRIGGDEFLAFVRDSDSAEVAAQIRQIKQAVLDQGYHLSIGYCSAPPTADIHELVNDAEQKMFEEKRRYYSNSDHDRRGHFRTNS